MTPRSQTSPWLPKHTWVAFWIMVVATALRFYQLQAQPVWCDESLFWQYSNRPGGWLTCLLHTMADDVYPPFFFLLLHFLGLFTNTLFLIRLPMALAGVAAVAVLMLLLRRFAGARAALFGGALVATSPVLIYYSQELKMYSFLALFLLLLLYETMRLMNEPKRGWAWLTLWAVLSVYTFYLSLIVWFCLLSLAWWQSRNQIARAKNIFKGYGVAGLIFLPWLPIFVKSIVQNQGSTYNLLMERVYLYSYQNFSIGFWLPPWLTWSALAIYSILVVVGIAQKRTSPAWRLLVGFCFLPLLLSWAVSLMAKPIYSDRAMLACAFAWLALAAVGLAGLPRRFGWLGLTLCLGFNAYAMGHYYFDPASRRVDYKPAWEYIVNHWQPGDTVFHTHIDSYYPFRFFALQEASGSQGGNYKELPNIMLPEGSTRAEGLRPNWIHSAPPPFTSNQAAGTFRKVWRGFNAWLTAHGRGLYTGYNRDLVADERLRQEALPGVSRIWYLNTDQDASAKAWMPQINVYRSGFKGWVPFVPEKMEWLTKHFRLVDHALVGETDIYLYEAKQGRKKRP